MRTRVVAMMGKSLARGARNQPDLPRRTMTCVRQGPTKLEGGRAWHRLLTGLVVLFLVNVASQFAYFVMSIVIGGDAVHGKVVGGQYLLRRVSTSGYID